MSVIKYPKIITSNNGTSVVLYPVSKEVKIYDTSANILKTIAVLDEIDSISVNFTENLLAIGLPEDSESKNIKTFQFDGTEVYNYEYITGTTLGTFVHLSEENQLTVSSDVSTNEFQLREYTTNIELEHKATYITLDPSNLLYPDTSANFVIQLTTNDVSLTTIQNNLSIEPLNIATISKTTLTNYGFTLEGQLDASGEQNISGVKLFYEDFSSNAFDIYSIQDLSINEFSFNISSVTYENYLSNNITLTLNRSDLTNVDISNSLQILPSICGQIVDVSGTGVTRTITFTPTFYINEPDCSLTFHYTQTEPYLDASMTIPFSVDTLQQIEDISMNPRSILKPTSSATLGVKFRLPVESSGTPDITISPSYIANINSISAISGGSDTWTGVIQRSQNKNRLYNNIDFSFNGFDISLNFNVAQSPELIVGPREICDFVECRGIKITSSSLTEAFTIKEVIITDENGIITNSSVSSYDRSSGIDAASIMDGNINNTSTISATTEPEEKWFQIVFTTNKKIKEITLYASNSVKIELLTQTQSGVYETITNLGQVNVDVSGTINIANASTQSTITRAVTNIALVPSNIEYPDVSSNFEIVFTTNDKTLDDISGNLQLDPSGVGNLTNLQLVHSGFKLVGNIEASDLTKNKDTKLKYFETEDVSGESNPFTIYTYPQFHLVNIGLTPENIVGPNDVSSNLQIEFNVPISNGASLNNSITIDPSYIVNLDTMTTSDDGYTWSGAVSRSQYMNKLGNKLEFNFTDNSLSDLSDNPFTASAELLFDVLESKNVLKWEKKTDTSLNDMFNESLEISPNGQILAQISGLNAKIYHLQSDSTWSLESEISGNHLALCDNRIAIATSSDINVYEYNGSNWIPIESITQSNVQSNVSNLGISIDGNRVAYVYDVSSIGIQEYSSGWIPMTITVPITGNNVKFSPNGSLLGIGTLDSENQNFSNVVLYEYSEDTSSWNLKP